VKEPMPRKLIVASAIASLVLAGPSRAADTNNSHAAPPLSGVRGLISCHGIRNVPITSDAEQTIPFKLVATLNCGDEVAVISDSEGYTAQIRTADGKNGYVATVYLVKTSQPVSDAPAPYEEAAVSENGVVRWRSGQPGSQQLFSSGNLVESITANGITVQVSLVDSGWKLRAEVAVANASEQAVGVQPKRFTLAELQPALKSLTYQDPSKMADALNHQVLWTSASAAPAQSAVAHHVVFDGGNFSSVAYKPAPPPNYLAQHQAAERSTIKAVPMDSVSQIKALALHDAILKPSDKVSGAVWFERDATCKELSLVIPVGDLIFEFPFSFSH
jgi:hypothetical protein